MSGDSWFKFFSSDFLSGVAALSAAERGVYITLLAIMYDNGGPIKRDDGRLSRICGLPKIGFSRALDSLIGLGKIVVEGECLVNSRVKTMLTERANRVEHSRKGARVTNEKKSKKSIDGSRSTDRSTDPTAHAKGSLRAVAREPEPDIEITSVISKETRAGFARFWSAWPNKVQRAYAEKCFAKVAPEIEAIVSGVEKYVREKPPDRPWLNPSTFLNQRRWEDAPAAIGAPNGRSQSGSLIEAGFRAVRRETEREAAMRGETVSDLRNDALRLLSQG